MAGPGRSRELGSISPPRICSRSPVPWLLPPPPPATGPVRPMTCFASWWSTCPPWPTPSASAPLADPAPRPPRRGPPAPTSLASSSQTVAATRANTASATAGSATCSALTLGGSDGRPVLYVMDWVEPDDGTPSEQIVSGYTPIGYVGEDMRDVYMFKMCMSCPDPISDPNCVVVAVYSGGHYLACCRPGDSEWTHIESTPPLMTFEDVVFHRGNFYAVNHHGHVMVIDGIAGAGRHPTARQIASPLPFLFPRKYLVGLPSGELLYVSRQLGVEDDPFFYWTVNFRAFKLDLTLARPSGRRWIAWAISPCSWVAVLRCSSPLLKSL